MGCSARHRIERRNKAFVFASCRFASRYLIFALPSVQTSAYPGPQNVSDGWLRKVVIYTTEVSRMVSCCFIQEYGQKDGRTDAEESSRLIILKKEEEPKGQTATWQFGPSKAGQNKFSSPEIYLSLASFIFGIKVHQSMSNDLNITHSLTLSPSTSLCTLLHPSLYPVHSSSQIANLQAP